MKLHTLLNGKSLSCGISLLAIVVLVACSTPSAVNWDKQVGVYTWEEALADLGPPDEVTDDAGGVKRAVWSKQRTVGITPAADSPSYYRGETVNPSQTYGSTAPAKVLQLSFTPDGKLFDWQRNY